MNKTQAFIAGAVFSVLLGSCEYEEPINNEQLDVQLEVLRNDGISPVNNHKLDYYDWVAELKDGSTVMRRMSLADGFERELTTDSAGQCSFSRGDIALKSGNLAESCSNVCVSETYVPGYYWDDCYESCSSGSCYDECWEECDEYGCYTVCDTYCEEDVCDYVCESVWEPGYSYCDTYAESCNYYYPNRNFNDVLRAWGEIGISDQAKSYQVLSETITSPEQGKISKHQWSQQDRFVTPLSSVIVSPELQLARQMKGAKAQGKRSKYRSRPAPKIIRENELDQLNVEQKAKLDRFRANYSTAD